MTAGGAPWAARARRAIAVMLVSGVGGVAVGCAHGPRPGLRDEARAPCAALDAPACGRARNLVAAAPLYADEPHALVLLDASFAPGRGIARTASGDRVGPTACAQVTAPPSAPRLDVSTIEYSFVGFAIDATLVSSDADVGPLLADGDHTIALVALAIAHDEARGTLAPGASLVAKGNACACGDASHVVGETLYGASVAYRGRAPHVGASARAIDVFQRALDADARFVESRIGRLTVDGTTPYLAGRAARPLAFRVDHGAPVARALRTVDEACPSALPAPLLSPSPIDFGVAAYGTAATRAVHVVNRGAVPLDAVIGARTMRVPARGAADLPLTWTPDGDAWSCEAQTREEAIRFVPVARSSALPPSEPVASLLEVIRTGRPSVTRSEHVDPKPADPRDKPATREWSCPPDFAIRSCHMERALGESKAQATTSGCRFTCRGRDGGPCAFDARMECALHCPE